jgi:hypothetical protein
MSTSYGIKCKDCKKQTPTNFRPFAVVEIVKLWKHFEAIYKSEEYTVAFEIKIHNNYDEPSILDFLSEHGAHQLTVVSEYGHELEGQEYALTVS